MSKNEIVDASDLNHDYTVPVTSNDSKELPREITIIEKNKTLAKCGRGVLSITDNEDTRLNEILAENIDDSVKWFRGSEETQNRLKEIDRQLKIVAPAGPSVVAEEQTRPMKKLVRLKKVSQRLEEIRKLNEDMQLSFDSGH